MDISTKTRYALRALIELAIQCEKEKKPIQLNIISQNQKISLRYLENLFHILTKHHIIKGHKGKFGGFTFIKNPKDIFISEIILILDNPLSKIPCLTDSRSCDLYTTCHTTNLWSELYKQIINFFSKISIEDLKEKTIKNKNYI